MLSSPLSPNSIICVASSFKSVSCGESWSHLWHFAPEAVSVNEVPLNSVPLIVFLHSMNEEKNSKRFQIHLGWSAGKTRHGCFFHVSHVQSKLSLRKGSRPTLLYTDLHTWEQHSTPISCWDPWCSTKDHLAHCQGFCSSSLQGEILPVDEYKSENNGCNSWVKICPCMAFDPGFSLLVKPNVLELKFEYHLEVQVLPCCKVAFSNLFCEVYPGPSAGKLCQTQFWWRKSL